MTLVNLGHHSGTLGDGADPWSRALDKRRQNYLWTEPCSLSARMRVLSRCCVGLWDLSVRGPALSRGLASNLLYVALCVPFWERLRQQARHSASIFVGATQNGGRRTGFRSQ